MNDPYGPPGGGGYPGPSGGYSGPGYPPPQGYQQPGYQQQGYQQPGFQQQGFQQQGYLQGGPVDFQGAIRQQIDNVMNFEGRASRSAYWWYALAIFGVVVVLEIFSSIVGSSALGILISLVLLVVGLSGLSLAVRRLHDVNMSGWWLLLSLTIIGGLVVLFFLLQPGTPGQNRFG